jgi:hypothetical protein
MPSASYTSTSEAGPPVAAFPGRKASLLLYVLSLGVFQTHLQGSLHGLAGAGGEALTTAGAGHLVQLFGHGEAGSKNGMVSRGIWLIKTEGQRTSAGGFP